MSLLGTLFTFDDVCYIIKDTKKDSGCRIRHYLASMMQNTNDTTQNSAKSSADNQNDKNPRLSYVSQKTERLAGALYAITRSFPDGEPLRAELRAEALELVSCAHGLQSEAGKGNASLHLQLLLSQLCSQLLVARDGGLISAMNVSVLRDEIQRFSGELEDIGITSGLRLTGDYFESSLPAAAKRESKRNISPAYSSSVGERARAAATSQPTDSSNAVSRSLSPKDKRRQSILDLFDERDEITVNDVTDVVNGYSTKTIQRDLKALVKSGQLEKHGKRRWSSYTKA